MFPPALLPPIGSTFLGAPEASNVGMMIFMTSSYQGEKLTCTGPVVPCNSSTCVGVGNIANCSGFVGISNLCDLFEYFLHIDQSFDFNNPGKRRKVKQTYKKFSQVRPFIPFIPLPLILSFRPSPPEHEIHP